MLVLDDAGQMKGTRRSDSGRGLQPRWFWVGGAVITLLLAIFLAYSFVEPHWLKIKEVTFSSPDVPKAFDGVRVAFIADIHRGPFFSQARVRRLVDKVNALKPDMILLGGDYVLGDPVKYSDSCFQELARLKAPLGCFAVLGNHDYGKSVGPSTRAIKNAGITLLDNRGVWIDKGDAHIRLGGVGDYEVDTPDVGPVLYGTKPSDFVLLVSHNPAFVHDLQPGQVDLMLSGHTHGGQITFFGLWAPVLPRHVGQGLRSGVVKTDATTVIVSNGVGTIFPPMRFFARPDIVVVTLRSGSPATP